MFGAAASALVFSVLGASAGPLPFIEDDHVQAQERAIKEGKLIAVDVWATWCHTCLSMKNFILTDPEMKKLADTHVWLALDYDLEKNAAFFQQYPVEVFPTFLVVDPKAKKVVSRWAGSGTVEQMLGFFAGASRETKDPLQAGRQALATKNYPEAERQLLRALESETDAARRTEILAALVEATWRIDPARCAALGQKYITETNDTAPGVDFVAIAAGCVDALKDEAQKKAFWVQVRDRLVRTQKSGLARLTVDDRSTVYETLTSAHRALGDEKAALAVVAVHAKELEAGAQKAKTPEARATFDAYRLACYLELQRYKDAEQMLARSEKDMPKDFNPPWRLAVLYHAEKKTEAGLSAIERALSRGYGPRRARLHITKIDLLLQKTAYKEALTAIDAARKDLGRLDPVLIRKAWTDQLDAKEKQARSKLES